MTLSNRRRIHTDFARLSIIVTGIKNIDPGAFNGIKLFFKEKLT